MSHLVIERFLNQHGLLAQAPERLLGRPSQELLALSRHLRQRPIALGLSRLSEAQRQDLQTPQPPHLHQLALFLGTLLHSRPDLAARLGLPEGLLEALLRRQVDLGKLIKGAEDLAQTAETGKLLIGGALKEVNQEMRAAAARLGSDAALPPSRRDELSASFGALARVQERREATRVRRELRELRKTASAKAQAEKVKAEAQAVRATAELLETTTRGKEG